MMSLAEMRKAGEDKSHNNGKKTEVLHCCPVRLELSIGHAGEHLKQAIA